jgi:hypothetical protein
MKNKKALIYTIPRTGTNFLSFGLNVICPQVFMTHDHTKKGTVGEKINIKDYDVFVSLRKPKDSLQSNLLADNPISEEEIYIRVNHNIDENIKYFNIVLENKSFYIMKFEDFTTDTKNVFLKLCKDKKYHPYTEKIINTHKFFEDPMSFIKTNKEADLTRYPRIKNKEKVEQFRKIVNSETVKSQLVYLENLYDQVLDRYNSQ